VANLNWYVGWGSLLAAFITGALLGLFFHREDFLGGYSTFRRRILRLGHIALAALGMLNVLFAVSVADASVNDAISLSAWAFAIGGLSMPAICFLTAWKTGFRHLFFIPVTALIVAVIQMLSNGPP
jgi:hypothetical protein